MLELDTRIIRDPQRARTLWVERGFVAFGPPFLEPAAFARACEEARSCRASAWSCEHDHHSTRASPQRNHRADLGSAARAFLASPTLQSWLCALTGATPQLSHEASCFTYFEGAGQFLASHRDRPQSCRVTLLIYLDVVSGPEPSPGMYLRVGNPRAATANTADTADTADVWLRARPNRALLLAGAERWHERPPLAHGEYVSMIAACYSQSVHSPEEPCSR